MLLLLPLTTGVGQMLILLLEFQIIQLDQHQISKKKKERKLREKWALNYHWMLTLDRPSNSIYSTMRITVSSHTEPMRGTPSNLTSPPALIFWLSFLLQCRIPGRKKELVESCSAEDNWDRTRSQSSPLLLVMLSIHFLWYLSMLHD